MQSLQGDIANLKKEKDANRSIQTEIKDDGQKRLNQLLGENERLTSQIQQLRIENDRKISRMQQDFDKDLNEARRFASILISSTGATEQIEQLRSVINDYESKMRSQQNELTEINNRNSQLNFELSRRDVELSEAREKLNESQLAADFRTTAKP
jgi:CHASE3 domain sensor protein